MRAVSRRPPPPDGLAVIEAFVNSLDIIHRTEAFAGPQDLDRWLRDHGVLTGDVDGRASSDDDDVALAVRTREALRTLLIANAGDGPVEPEAVAAVNDAADRAGLTRRLDESGRPTWRTEAAGVPGAVGRIVGLAFEAMGDGTWNRLKACHADDCRWAFYDRSKAGRGTWCETSATGCGARAKMRAYRDRSQHDVA